MHSWGQPLADTLVTLMEGMRENFAAFASRMGMVADAFTDRTYMHDPLALYTAVANRYVRLRRLHVQMEMREGVVRTITYPDRTPNMQVCVDVDAPAFVGYWLERIQNLASGREQ